jgi:hypothetical protein
MAVTLASDALRVRGVIFDRRFVQRLLKTLNKLAELTRAHGAEHKERCSIVQSALSSNERETCVQCRVIKHLPTGHEYDSELNPSLACRLFAQSNVS